MSGLAFLVHVLISDGHRIDSEPIGHEFDPGFGHQHALRTAEASEGRVRLQVRLAAETLGAQVIDVVGVVGLSKVSVFK